MGNDRMSTSEFAGVFKFLRYIERVEEDSAKGQTVTFKAILRDADGRRVTVLSGAPFTWTPGQRVVVKIRSAGPDESAGVKPAPEPADVDDGE
jgi:hypothetical protein